MKVSLSRKIHIMAFPQDALLNARWSEDQSATSECQPPGCFVVSCAFAGATSGIELILTEGGAAERDEPSDGRCVRQQSEKADPAQQQEVPVGGAELDAGAQLRHAGTGLQPGPGPTQGNQPAEHVQPMHRGDEVEEGLRRVGRRTVAGGGELPPSQDLANKEQQRGEAAGQQPVLYTLPVAAPGGDAGPVQRGAAEQEDTGI